METYENCVIGTVLADPACMEAAEHLKPSDFTGAHTQLWDAVLDLHRRQSLGSRALIEQLRTGNILPSLGTDSGEIRGEEYIGYLATFADSATIREFVHQVEDNSIKRQLRGVAGLILQDARSEKEADEILDNAERSLYALRRTHVDSGATLGDILRIFLPRMHGIREGTIVPAWVPEVVAVREIVDYVDDTDFIIIAARPGEGKSSYLRWEALQAALKGQRVLTFNLENDFLEYAKFALAALCRIDSAKLKNPCALTQRELERVGEMARKLAALSWKIVTMARPTAMEIDRAARKLVAAEGYDLIQVDYLQLVSNGNEKRVEDLSITTSTLRGTAIRLGQPIMAASQFSRAIEYRGDNSDPKLSDLRESGSLEQDATQVWAQRSLWPNPPSEAQIRASGFPENFDERGFIHPQVKSIPVRMFVLKNRNGPIGLSDPIKWIKSTGEFQTLTRADGAAIARGIHVPNH